MCLFVNVIDDAQTATTNIPIYKVAIKSSIDENLYFSYFMKSEIKLNTPYQSGLDYPEVLFCYGSKVVEVGLHSFKNLEDALFFAKHKTAFDVNIKNINTRLVILGGYIPKGSKYYLGSFNEWESFASDQIIYDEVIDIITPDALNIDYVDKLK